MKRLYVIIFILCSCFLLFANGESEDVEFVHKPSSLIANVTENSFTRLWEKTQLSKSNQTKEEFENAYRKFKTEVVPSLSKKRTYMTAAEVEIMKTPAKRKSTVSLNDAKYDIDLFFRSLGYGYSVYDLLGGDELFLKMRREVLDEIERNQTSGQVSVDLIVQTLKKVLRTYIFDNHFGIEDDHFMDYDGKLVWQYNSGIFFEEDENGYFTIIDDKKYYFDSCDDETAIMVPFLKADGEITNSLVSFHNKYNEGLLSDIVLKNGDNEISVSPNWKKYKTDYYGDATIIAESNGILYLYPGMCVDNELFLEDELLKIAKRFQKEYKLLILDVRGSTGLGSDSEHAEAFIKSFFGKLPVANEFTCTVHTGLDHCYDESAYGKESLHYEGYSNHNKQRIIVENSVPVIVLSDKSNGCGGEGDVEPFRNVDNSVIIGTNTRGVVLAGGNTKRYLPKTGINFVLGVDIAVMNPSLENRESIGTVFPDLYVGDSRTLISAVMNMLVKSDVIDEETSIDLMTQIKDKRAELITEEKDEDNHLLDSYIVLEESAVDKSTELDAERTRLLSYAKYYGLDEDIHLITDPKTIEDYANNVLYNALLGDYSSWIAFSSESTVNKILDELDKQYWRYHGYFDELTDTYYELLSFYFYGGFSYKLEKNRGTYFLKRELEPEYRIFKNILSEKELFEQQTQAIDELIEVSKSFHENGIIRDDMSELEIAEVYLTYVNDKLKKSTYYADVSLLSFVHDNNKWSNFSVCSVYNILLRTEGIKAQICETVSDGILCRILADGNIYYVDLDNRIIKGGTSLSPKSFLLRFDGIKDDCYIYFDEKYGYVKK